MQVDWWTLSLQVINFLVLVYLLWRFLFQPVRDIIARRKETVTAASGELAEAEKQAAAEKRHYEEATRALAEDRRKLESELHKELAQEREAILKQTREQAAQIVQDARSRVAKERENALNSLRGDVADLAAGMAAHLLQDASPETYSNLLLDRICRRLEELNDDERRQLEKDLTQESTVISITTAIALDETDQREWTAKLQSILNASAEVEFKTDARLVAGAELRLPHAVCEFSWADQLESVKARLNA